ncbi:hypothetical protein M433DRAFT_147475 [Acidomyces richmondensis BFW]|nr:MAG: hypothetical protein FE78DRAFT_68478 [Acidomyces sp. 'richmondensis']KYG41672.1 hypothetical protein M433DRAFT_147475 [Acidomyces richmondensis BFW]
MLSLPLIMPHEDPSIFLRATFRPRPESPPPASGANQNVQSLRQAQLRRDEERKAYNARAPLAILATEEAAIASRKAAIRNFGAYWIRPPGVAKTLQAMHEEEAERIEQEELARQEQGFHDMQAQQTLADARAQATAAAADADATAAAGEERDLDDDIPDGAEATADLSFNEDSMLDGSSQIVSQHELQDDEQQQALEMEEAELTGTARDEQDLGIERDLDDSVPEAGSYQHTDTDIEDSSSDNELQDSFAVQSARRTGQQRGQQLFLAQAQRSITMNGLQERTREQAGTEDALTRSPGNLNLSSSILESSFVGSSPVLQRGFHVVRGRGGRRQRVQNS